MNTTEIQLTLEGKLIYQQAPKSIILEVGIYLIYLGLMFAGGAKW